MKLRYIFATLAAVTALASCDEDFEPTVLDNIQVSSSYVAIPMDGGSTSIQLTTDDSFEITGAPSWLTISPLSGGAGTTTITFSADATLDGRSTEDVRLTSGGKTQNINVIQGLATVSTATCAEVIAGPDSKTYLTSGVVTAIANTTYGNFYINDGTGEIYIYGTLYAGKTQNNPITNNNIEVGDEVVVQGPKTTYNGTVELVDVTVVSVNKSLMKCDSLSVATLPVEGGEFIAYLTCKGSGVNVEIPEDAQDWLSIKKIESIGTASEITFQATPNEKGDRSTTLTFSTVSGGKSYTSQATITQLGAIVDCSVAEFNAAEVGTTTYRITAVVSSINNASKGRFYIKDYSGETYVYNMSGFEATGIKVGDIVTLTGYRAQYNTTIEMTSAALVSLKPVTEVRLTDFLVQEDNADVYYMVSGTVSSVANATYGNLYIKDEAGNELYVYGCYPGYGATGDARKNWLATAGIAVGDELTMIGYKTTYNGVVELCGGIYFSHTSANQQ